MALWTSLTPGSSLQSFWASKLQGPVGGRERAVEEGMGHKAGAEPGCGAERPLTGHPKLSMGSEPWAVVDPGLIMVPLLPEMHVRVTELCAQQFTDVVFAPFSCFEYQQGGCSSSPANTTA